MVDFDIKSHSQMYTFPDDEVLARALILNKNKTAEAFENGETFPPDHVVNHPQQDNIR
jgi:hypothetical protein